MNTNEQRTKNLSWFNRKLVVNSSVQYVLLKYSVTMGFLFMSMGLFLAYLLLKIPMIQMNGFASIEATDIVFLSFLLIIIFIVGYFGLILSNRVVGPIFRLVKSMEEFEETGNYQEIRFRKNDYFKEIAVSYNKIMIRLHDVERRNKKSSEGQ